MTTTGRLDLTSATVESIFRQCLANKEDDYSMEVEGIIHNVVLNGWKVDFYKPEIKGFVEQLPTEFLKDGGGGWTFLNLCMRADGEQWTGLHLVCEQLYVLAAALGMAKIQLPREMWGVLPGNVPYIIFDPEGRLGDAAPSD